MTHYQKLATLVFRIMGALTMIAGVLFGLWAVFVALSFWGDSLLIFLPFLLYSITGLILFAVSRTLARWVCFDFDKTDEN